MLFRSGVTGLHTDAFVPRGRSLSTVVRRTAPGAAGESHPVARGIWTTTTHARGTSVLVTRCATCSTVHARATWRSNDRSRLAEQCTTGGDPEFFNDHTRCDRPVADFYVRRGFPWGNRRDWRVATIPLPGPPGVSGDSAASAELRPDKPQDLASLLLLGRKCGDWPVVKPHPPKNRRRPSSPTVVTDHRGGLSGACRSRQSGRFCSAGGLGVTFQWLALRESGSTRRRCGGGAGDGEVGAGRGFRTDCGVPGGSSSGSRRARDP